jgi:hypothetical protein
VFNIKGTSIPILGHATNYTKYLGIQSTSVGLINANVLRDQVKAVLDKLQKFL